MLIKGGVKMKRRLVFIISVVFFMLFLNINSAVGYSEGIINELDREASNEDEWTIENLGPDWYNKPANHAELVSWYEDLESEYPQYLELYKANDLYDTGTVTGGYDLYYLRITNENLGLDKPEVLFLGGPG